MVLTLDIQKKAAPIIRQTHKVKLWPKAGPSQNIGEDINDLILTIEGFDNHVFALSKTEAKDLLDETNKVITVFVDIDEEISVKTDDKEVIERFKYALKALFKLKSLLHLAYTKDLAVRKTPNDIRQGLAAVSRSSVLTNFLKQ